MGAPKSHGKTNHSHSSTFAWTQFALSIALCTLPRDHCNSVGCASELLEGAMASAGFNVAGKMNMAEVS